MEKSKPDNGPEFSANDVVRAALTTENIPIHLDETNLVPRTIQVEDARGELRTVEFMGEQPEPSRQTFTSTPPPPKIRPKWLDEPL